MGGSFLETTVECPTDDVSENGTKHPVKEEVRKEEQVLEGIPGKELGKQGITREVEGDHVALGGKGDPGDVKKDEAAVIPAHGGEGLPDDLSSNGPVGGDKARIAADHDIPDPVFHGKPDGLSDEACKDIGGAIRFIHRSSRNLDKARLPDPFWNLYAPLVVLGSRQDVLAEDDLSLIHI